MTIANISHSSLVAIPSISNNKEAKSIKTIADNNKISYNSAIDKLSSTNQALLSDPQLLAWVIIQRDLNIVKYNPLFHHNNLQKNPLFQYKIQPEMVSSQNNNFNQYASIEVLNIVPTRLTNAENVSTIKVTIDSVAKAECWRAGHSYPSLLTPIVAGPDAPASAGQLRSGEFSIKRDDNMLVFNLNKIKANSSDFSQDTVIVNANGSDGYFRPGNITIYQNNKAANIGMLIGDTVKTLIGKLNNCALDGIKASFENDSIVIRSLEFGPDFQISFEQNNLFSAEDYGTFSDLSNAQKTPELRKAIDGCQRYELIKLEEGDRLIDVIDNINASTARTRVAARAMLYTETDLVTFDIYNFNAGAEKKIVILDGFDQNNTKIFLNGENNGQVFASNLNKNEGAEIYPGTDAICNLKFYDKSGVEIANESYQNSSGIFNISDWQFILNVKNTTSDGEFLTLHNRLDPQAILGNVKKLATNMNTTIASFAKSEMPYIISSPPADPKEGALSMTSNLLNQTLCRNKIEDMAQQLVTMGWAKYDTATENIKLINTATSCNLAYPIITIGAKEEAEIMRIILENPKVLKDMFYWNYDVSFPYTTQAGTAAQTEWELENFRDLNWKSDNGDTIISSDFVIDLNKAGVAVNNLNSSAIVHLNAPVVGSEFSYDKFKAGTFYIGNKPVTLDTNDSWSTVTEKINSVAQDAIGIYGASAASPLLFYVRFNLLGAKASPDNRIDDPDGVLGYMFKQINVSQAFTFPEDFNLFKSDGTTPNNFTINGQNLALANPANATIDDLVTLIRAQAPISKVDLEQDKVSGKYYFTEAGTGKNYFIFKATSLENAAPITIDNSNNFFKNGFVEMQRVASSDPMLDVTYNLEDAFDVTYTGSNYGLEGVNTEFTKKLKPHIQLDDPTSLDKGSIYLYNWKTENTPVPSRLSPSTLQEQPAKILWNSNWDSIDTTVKITSGYAEMYNHVQEALEILYRARNHEYQL